MILSKAFLKEDLMTLLILMEGLFVKRWHIKDLSLSNVKMFLTSKLSPNPFSDLKLTSIYSKKYSHSEVNQTVKTFVCRSAKYVKLARSNEMTFKRGFIRF